MATRHRSRRAPLALLPFLLGPLLAEEKDPAPPPPPPAEKPAPPPAQPGEGEYIRFVPDGKDAGRLESAIATFRSPEGRTVHLVAAVHIADASYYKELMAAFEGYEAVLYEMVKPRELEPDDAGKSTSLVSAFQRGLKDLLGLEFQLDGIDYKRKNFIHADMDAETFAEMQRERGENLFTLMLRAVLDDLNRQSRGEGEAPLNGFDLLRAFLQKDRARALKLLLARQFKDMEARLLSFEGEKGSVILTERNKVAMGVLKRVLEEGKKNVGIFYGGGHMADLEKRLKDLGFERRSARWVTAWTIR